MCIEIIVVFTLLLFYKDSFDINNRYTSISGMIGARMVSYVIILFIENYSDMKKGVNIPNVYWLSMFFIPLGSLYIITVLFKETNFTTYNSIFSMGILFAVNIVTFYLYDVLTKLFEDRMGKIILKEQNKYYQKQLETMDTNNENSRAFNHDLRNHLAIVRGYIQINESEEACKYIDKMTGNEYTIKQISNSGNMDIDNILNCKLYEASKNNISLSLKVEVPKDIKISSFDIGIILGNLLDNAIEAVSKAEEDNKKIDIVILYKTDALSINIKNTFDGCIFYKKNKIVTSKKDMENHGIGLDNIKRILKRYNGTMKIDYDDNEFCVDIILYVK